MNNSPTQTLPPPFPPPLGEGLGGGASRGEELTCVNATSYQSALAARLNGFWEKARESRHWGDWQKRHFPDAGARTARWLRELADFFLPRRCPVCLRPADLLDSAFCRKCLEGFSFIESPRCTLCGTPFKSPFQEDHLCQECLEGRFGFDGAFSVFFYRDTLREAVHRFKYSARVLLAGALADYLLRFGGEWVKERTPDVLAPVPSRSESIRARGFNPALMLARRVHGEWGLPIKPRALRFHKRVPSQAGLNRSERLRNVKGAFAADPDQVEGRRILLLDDVMTTGATGDECARTLKRAGAEKVFVITLARTVGWDIFRSTGSPVPRDEDAAAWPKVW